MAESVFEAVKQSITVREAAQMYGIEVNRSGMACCPFHDDKNPSMKLNEEYFYCFGCGATGDVIDFTARLYNLSPKEAAEKLAQDFGLAYVAYRKAGYSRKFREEHEQEILLHQAAKNAFDEMGVKKLPKVKDLQSEYAKLLEEKKKTYAEYRRSREEMRELLTAKANVDRLLKMDEEQKKEQEKDHGQR